jgi:hypothetical protein
MNKANHQHRHRLQQYDRRRHRLLFAIHQQSKSRQLLQEFRYQ